VDLRIWNLSDILSGGDIQPVSIFESPPRLFDMVFSPNGAFVAASTYGYGQLAGLLVGNVETGTILYFLEADEICCPVFSPDNAVLAFATGKILISEPQPKLTVHYLDLKTLEEMATPLEGRIVFNADWTLAADIDVGEYGGYPQNTVVRLWDAESGGLIKVLDNYDDDSSHLPIVLAFSPDSRLLVSASIYYPTLIWDTSTFEYSALPIGGASDIEFSADSKLIVVGRAGSGITDFVQLWGVPSEQDG
jgi:WD40 repeat protein